ncbi:MAG: hypothetical protein AB4352_21650 [Hormoscilla sp.]
MTIRPDRPPSIRGGDRVRSGNSTFVKAILYRDINLATIDYWSELN